MLSAALRHFVSSPPTPPAPPSLTAARGWISSTAPPSPARTRSTSASTTSPVRRCRGLRWPLGFDKGFDRSKLNLKANIAMLGVLNMFAFCLTSMILCIPSVLAYLPIAP